MFDTDPQFWYSKFSNTFGSKGPGNAYDFNTSKFGEGQYVLQPAYQIGPRDIAVPSDQGQEPDFVKRYTLQVGPLQYPDSSIKYTEYSSKYLLIPAFFK